MLAAVEALAALPAEEDVAGRVRDALALDDALAVVRERAGAQVRLEHRRPAPPWPAARAGRGRRGRRAGRSTRASRRCRRRRPCGPCRRTGTSRTGSAGRGRGRRRTGRAARWTKVGLVARAGRVEELAEGHQQRRDAAEAQLAVDALGELPDRAQARLAPRLGERLGEQRSRPLAPSLPPKRSTSSLAVRRSYQTSRWLSSREAAHPLAVLADARRHDRPPPAGRAGRRRGRRSRRSPPSA